MAGNTSRENGKKGGRKKGLASIKAEEARNVLAQMVYAEITPLGKRLIAKAKKGDVFAFKELMDRAFGKAPQFVDITSKGKELPRPILPNVPAHNSDKENKGAH